VQRAKGKVHVRFIGIDEFESSYWPGMDESRV
jgi:hypothetical protein